MIMTARKNNSKKALSSKAPAAGSNRRGRKDQSREEPLTENDRLDVVSMSSDGCPSKEYITKPRDLDICCGRGKGFFSHPGNKIFQDSVRDNMLRYTESPSKNLKSEVVSSMVNELFLKGIRFVKRDPDSGNRWYVLTPALAHEKTGHAIRDSLMQMRKTASSKATGAGVKGVVPVSPRLSSSGTASKSKQAIKKKTSNTKKTKARPTPKASCASRKGQLLEGTGIGHSRKQEESQEEDQSPFPDVDIVSLTSSSVQDHEIDLFDDFVIEAPPVDLSDHFGDNNHSGLKRIISEASAISADAPRHLLFSQEQDKSQIPLAPLGISGHSCSTAESNLPNFPDEYYFGRSEDPLAPNKVDLFTQPIFHLRATETLIGQHGTAQFDVSASDGLFNDIGSSTITMMHRDYGTWNGENAIVSFLPEDWL